MLYWRIEPTMSGGSINLLATRPCPSVTSWITNPYPLDIVRTASSNISNDIVFEPKSSKKGNRRSASQHSFVDNVVRFGVSCAALLALITPVCIMSLQPLTKNLVTSSVFMTLFACGGSFGVKCSTVETLVATQRSLRFS